MTGTGDVEYATVGGLVLAPQLLPDVRGWLHVEDFTRPACRTVYETLETMTDARRPVDPVSVLAELRAAGKLRRDGYPANELIRMVDSVPVPAAVDYYARLVVEASMFRHIEQAGIRLAQLGKQARGHADDAFDIAAQCWRGVVDAQRRWSLATGRDRTDAAPAPIGRALTHGRVIRSGVDR